MLKSENPCILLESTSYQSCPLICVPPYWTGSCLRIGPICFYIYSMYSRCVSVHIHVLQNCNYTKSTAVSYSYFLLNNISWTFFLLDANVLWYGIWWLYNTLLYWLYQNSLILYYRTTWSYFFLINENNICIFKTLFKNISPSTSPHFLFLPLVAFTSPLWMMLFISMFLNNIHIFLCCLNFRHVLLNSCDGSWEFFSLMSPHTFCTDFPSRA